jgi:hypothetical protein
MHFRKLFFSMGRTPYHVEAVKQLSDAGSCTCTRCVDSLAKSLAKAGAPNTPDHYWYRQGKDDGAQSERERIVAWLRRTLPSSIADLHDEADAIERGDHLA